MKKTMLLLAIALMVMVMSSGSAFAISGSCANCHTMHYSQNGTAPVGATGGPNAKLLLNSCLGCHAQTTALNIDTNGIPQVNSSNAAPLAGGSFLGGQTTTSYSHNPAAMGGTVAVQDVILTSPPGDGNATGITQVTFSCAGTTGCHGNRSVAGDLTSLQGAHHNNTAGALTTADSVGNSYRFLLGVHGNEDADWQDTVGAADHNQYKGATTSSASTATAPGGNTISGLCGECHGTFHGAANDADIRTGGEWIRHPTDHEVPNSGEYSDAFGSVDGGTDGTYDPAVPVASVNVGSVLSAIRPGAAGDNMIVMCLSCHKAHGSGYADILRWDYNTMVAGSSVGAGTGCFKCHTLKDA